MIKIKDYKGYAIYYENSDFLLYLDGEKVAEAPTEQALIAKADKLTKQSFTPIPAYDHNLRHGKITSYNPESNYPEFWFSSDDNRRGKHSIYGSTKTSFALDTPENKVIIEQILKLQQNINQVNHDIKVKEDSLTYITKEYLEKHLTES